MINKMPGKSSLGFGPTRRAPALRNGDTIGVVAPARWVDAAARCIDLDRLR